MDGFSSVEPFTPPSSSAVAIAAHGPKQERLQLVLSRTSPDPSKSQRAALRKVEREAREEFFTALGYERVAIGSGWGRLSAGLMQALSVTQAEQLWEMRGV